MQVRGLADCNFTLLNREIQHANRRDRINIISKYMDYRLYRVDSEAQVPKELLSIAAMLELTRRLLRERKIYEIRRKRMKSKLNIDPKVVDSVRQHAANIAHDMR